MLQVMFSLAIFRMRPGLKSRILKSSEEPQFFPWITFIEACESDVRLDKKKFNLTRGLGP